ncbi:tRNA-histidine guanylyltransferase 1-like, partial [Linderina pennispora]
EFFPDTKLQFPPAFDSRVVQYPSDRIMRDYLCWRQVDCHINNMYNTCFWTLVKGGMSNKDAMNRLEGTFSKDKNELLFSEFGINYNDEKEIFKKGSVLVRENTLVDVTTPDGKCTKRTKTAVVTMHCDIIRDAFWNERPELTRGKPTRAERKAERAKQREVELAAEAEAERAKQRKTGDRAEGEAEGEAEAKAQ